MKILSFRLAGAGLNDSRDPSKLAIRPDENNQNLIVMPAYPVWRNMISTDMRSSRTRMGFKSLTDEAFYPAGTSGSVSLLAKTSAGTIDGNLILIQKHTTATGTVGTPVAGFLPATAAIFTPADIGNVVKDDTSGNKTIITRFVNSTLVEVNNDYFTTGSGAFTLYRGGDTKGCAYYLIDGVNSIANNTVIGEMNDDDWFYTVMFQNRLIVLSGANRGSVLYKDSFRPLGMLPMYDNNSLGVTTPAGDITGSVKWALCFEDGDTYKLGAPMYIEDVTTDGFYVLANERLELDVSTLPTNTSDTWTHYALYRKMAEWDSFRRVARIPKTATTFSGNTTGSQEKRLINTAGSFTEDNVGFMVENQFGDTAYVTGRVDANTLKLDTDIFKDGEPWFWNDGFVTSDVVNEINDTNANFTSADVGKKVRKWDYTKVATVTTFHSSTRLGLDGDIIDANGDGYVFLDVLTGEGLNYISDTTKTFDDSYIGKYVQLEDGTTAQITSIPTGGAHNGHSLGLDADIGSTGDGYDISDGHCTETKADALVDNRYTFVAGDVGKAVYDSSGGTATITALVSTSEVTINSDIFVYTPEAYTTFFGDNRVASVVAASNPLIESRYIPAGAVKAFVWDNRIFYYGGYSASLTGITVTKDSADITLATAQAAEWMIGHNIFISSTGTPGLVAYQIKNVKSTTAIELFATWQGETVAGSATAKVVADQNEIWPGFQTFADCELTHPLLKIEVEKFDGDQIMHADVVRGMPVAIKRNGVYLIQITSIADPVANEIPDMFYRVVDLKCKDGCVGYRAACKDSKGIMFWFSATGGLMAFDGGSPRSVSTSDMRNYFLRCDEDLFWEATVTFNESTSEVVVGNLTKNGTGNYAVAFSTATGKWREISEFEVNAVEYTTESRS